MVLVFPGYPSSAEAIAFYSTHTRFETLADRDGFIVVYGNGLPNPPNAREHASSPKGGFLSGCLAPHAGEGVDVAYVRQLLDQLAAELPIDRTRIYATGFSAGGGMSFQLAIEAPDLVAAIAPVAPLPFQPTGGWLLHCHPQPGHDRISIAMVAATDDPFITYGGGGSREYPSAHYPGMERARDVWVAALGLAGPPEVDALPDVVQGDSYEPDTGRRPARSNASATARDPTAASSGTTRRPAWGTLGRTRRSRGSACGNASARRTRTSTSPTRRGRSSSGTSNADTTTQWR